MDPYLSEIRIMPFNYAPKGWALCNGQVLQISHYEALFALLGTTFGGDGSKTFALPDLRGRAPLHFSDAHPFAEVGGEPGHALSINEIASHTHLMYAKNAPADEALQGGNVPAPNRSLAQASAYNASTQIYDAAFIYGTGGETGTFSSGAMTMTGEGLPHENRQPSLALNFCISMSGIWPSPT